MHYQQGGEVCACFGHLEVFGRCSNWFGQFFEQFSAEPVTWGGLTALQAVRCVAGGLIAPGMVSRILLFDAFPCCIVALVQGECALAQEELAYVQGELFMVFELWFGGLCSLFEHVFVSDVSSRCPCLRGPRLVFFK
jgi:hypothetical protein